MTKAALSELFCSDYYSDRDAFLAELERFAARTDRRYELHSFAVDEARDLRVSAVWLPARTPERMLVLCSGIHGVEGYAGAAVIRQLLRGGLDALNADDTGLLLVHALNPFGFQACTRVNAANVDLNRNCQLPGEALFETDSSEFVALSEVLAPARPLSAAGLPSAHFYASMLAALARHGAHTLRQASLGGQYVDPRAIFFGGQAVQPEIAFFQGLFERLAAQHRELLLVDLHTGYGLRGEAYPLFGRADSASVRALSELGVSDQGGQDKTYTVHGDLIGYCYETAKRLRPDGLFNGLALEIGTHGLTIADQLRDLCLVVRENQLRNWGGLEGARAARVRDAFRELFCPSDPAWRARAVEVGVRGILNLLLGCGLLRPAHARRPGQLLLAADRV